ncbi:hypothetical protein D3C73_364810 [compost metagenome]
MTQQGFGAVGIGFTCLDPFAQALPELFQRTGGGGQGDIEQLDPMPCRSGHLGNANPHGSGTNYGDRRRSYRHFLVHGCIPFMTASR